MKSTSIIVAGIASSALVLSACAGREARPVQTARATDTQLSCELMASEITTNIQTARALTKEQNETSGKNVAVAAVGVLLFPPLLFAMNLKEAEKAEMLALRDRNLHLRRLMTAKGCTNIPPASPAEQDKMTRQARAKEAARTGKQPRCADVGGYEKYMKDTGKVCQI
jgi:hypothetical protein